MANKGLTITLWAKNMMQRGLDSAWKGIKGLGSAIVKLGKWAAVGFGAVASGLVAAAYQAQEFNKQIGQISTLTSMPMRKIKKEVIALSAEFGLAKEELTKGLYDALSAGVPQDNVFDFMRTASKMAIGGAASTAEAVDLLTTSLNAFKIPASETGKVADALFTTVKLGKTTVAELAQNFAQVAPIAAASGVKIEQVLSAVATLTKQGTPTAQAMTQIRAAIVSMNEQLGDGWTQTMTLQEGFQAMSDKAGGSTNALKDLTGRIEGTLAILATTGKNAKGAAEDIDAMAKSSGEAEKAFRKMKDLNPFDKLKQSINGAMLAAGDAALTLLAPTIIKAANAVKTFGENVTKWMESEKFKTLQTTVENIISAMGKAKGREEVGNAFVDVIVAGFAVAAENIVSTLKTAAPVIGKLMGAALKVVWENIKPITGSEFNAAREELGISKEDISRGRIIFSPEEYKANEARIKALEEQIKARAKLNREKQIYSEIGVDEIPKTDGETESKKRLNLALENLVKTAAKYHEEVAAATEETTTQSATPTATTGIPETAQLGVTDEDVAEVESNADKIKSIQQKIADTEIEIAKEKQDELDRINEDAWQNELELNKEKLKAAQELSNKRVQDVIDEAKAQKDHMKDLEKDQRKADRLRRLSATGAVLSKKDREFLRVADLIKNAGKGIPGIQDQIKVAESNLEQLKKQNATLSNLEVKFATLSNDLNQLLRAG